MGLFSRRARKDVKAKRSESENRALWIETLESRVVLTTPPVLGHGLPAFTSDDWTREELIAAFPALGQGSQGVPATNHLTIPEIEPNDGTLGFQRLPIALPRPGVINSATINGQIAHAGDTDNFLVQLRAGDVLGVGLQSGAFPLPQNGGTGAPLDPVINLHGPNGLLLYRNDDHNGLSTLFPPESPLPRNQGTTASLDEDSLLNYVIPEDGTYQLVVEGAGDGFYDMTVTVTRPGIENTPVGNRQRLFIDFDGAVIDASIFGVQLNFQPMSAALPGLGLTVADEDAMIDAIMASILENFNDLRLTANNGDFVTTGIAGEYDIEILNSRDHVDEFGTDPLVSRVVVGLSDMPGVGAAGLAQFIDPGNYSFDDTAWVDLTGLFGIFPGDPFNLNLAPFAPTSSIIELSGVVVGNIITHEAGHYLGNWHTTPLNFNPFLSIMDSGAGGLRNIGGIGPDGLFGTPDDIDVDFIVDTYFVAEGVGADPAEVPFSRPTFEDTRNVTAFAGATGTIFPTIRLVVTADPITGAVTTTLQPVDNGIFAIDVSQSMVLSAGLDTNRDGIVNRGDDENNDGVPGTPLDMAIATLLEARDKGELPQTVGLIAFAREAVAFDLAADAGVQLFIDIDADSDANGVPDFEQTLRSLIAGGGGVFATSTVNSDRTFYEAATTLITTVSATLTGTTAAVIVSDGSGQLPTTRDALDQYNILTHTLVVGPFGLFAPINTFRSISTRTVGVGFTVNRTGHLALDGGFPSITLVNGAIVPSTLAGTSPAFLQFTNNTSGSGAEAFAIVPGTNSPAVTQALELLAQEEDDDEEENNGVLGVFASRFEAPGTPADIERDEAHTSSGGAQPESVDAALAELERLDAI